MSQDLQRLRMKPHVRAVIVALTVAFGCFLTTGLIQPQIRRERVALNLAPEVEGEGVLPPNVVVLHAALGSFRSWIISGMWLRASQLQERGQLHEAVQLAEWIGRLQPRFERVWDFQSHNLSYNISRLGRTAEERWRWIEAGIDLTRTQGLRANPLSLRLHRTLSYIFWHKIGSESDSYHSEYKRLFALRWQRILGEPPQGTPSERVAWFEEIARASRADGEDVVDLVNSLPKEPRRAVDRLFRLLEAPDDQPWGEFREQWRRADPDRFGRLVARLRAQLLQERFDMDPDLMLDLMEQLGPLDWRHPAAHAVYWTAQGVLRRQAGRARVRLLPDPKSRRLVLQRVGVLASLVQLVLAGRLTYLPASQEFDRNPEVAMLTAYKEARLLEDEYDATTDENLKLYERLMGEATQRSFFEGREQDAAVFYAELQKRFEYRDSLSEFILKRFDEAVKEAPELRLAYVNLCVSVLARGVGRGRPEVSARLYPMIKGHHSRQPEAKPPWPEILREATEVYLESPEVATRKMRVWRILVPEARAELPRATLVGLYEQATDVGRSPESAFPGINALLGRND